MQVKLKILKGSNAGKEVKIPAPKCLIGRGEGCHLRPQSDAVSRRHSVIVTSENEVVIRDLNSRNGTIVNDQRISEETVLLNGDVVRIGPLEFEVLVEQKPGKPKRPAVNDLKEMLARTAESGNSSTTMEVGDINRWLEEADAVAKAARIADPETRQFKIDDTDPGTPSATGDTKVLEEAKKKAEEEEAKRKAAEEEAKKKAKKVPGKLPPRPSTSSANSRDAAADTLKKFFNRR